MWTDFYKCLQSSASFPVPQSVQYKKQKRAKWMLVLPVFCWLSCGILMDGGWSEPGRLSIAALVIVRVRPARPRAQPEMPSFKPGIFPPSFCNPNTFLTHKKNPYSFIHPLHPLHNVNWTKSYIPLNHVIRDKVISPPYIDIFRKQNCCDHEDQKHTAGILSFSMYRHLTQPSNI